jgi:hypothetical protein
LNDNSSKLKEGLIRLRKVPGRFTLNPGSFIEKELFHDKRRNLTVYERLKVNFIVGEF